MRSLLATVGTITAIALLSILLFTGVTVIHPSDSVTQRAPTEQTLAASEADRLVSERGPVAVRSHVLVAAELNTLSANDLAVTSDTTAVAVHVNGTRRVQSGVVDNGTTVERMVVLKRSDSQLERNDTVVVPAGATNVTVTAFDGQLIVEETPLTTREETAPPVSVVVSRSAPTRITAAGNVTVVYDTPRYEPAVVSVTVAREAEQ